MIELPYEVSRTGAGSSRTATSAAPKTTSVLTRKTEPSPAWSATSPSAGLPSPSARSMNAVNAPIASPFASGGARRTASEPEARVHERVAGAGDGRADEDHRRRRREPDECEPRRLDEHTDERDAGATEPVRQMAEQHAPENEHRAQRAGDDEALGAAECDAAREYTAMAAVGACATRSETR